jgi:hypothetical protein
MRTAGHGQGYVGDVGGAGLAYTSGGNEQDARRYLQVLIRQTMNKKAYIHLIDSILHIQASPTL